jgi:sugar lactone lactonase YvrE
MRRRAGAITSIGTSSWTTRRAAVTLVSPRDRVTSIQPAQAVQGGRVTIFGTDFPVREPRLPEVRIGDIPARIVRASSTSLAVIVPEGVDGGTRPIRIEGLPGETVFVEIGTELATGLHQVDNPVFDREGNLYVTYSGARGQEVPVSIFRVTPSGIREPFVTGIVNPTSMAFGPSGLLYVSSRFDGSVYRVSAAGDSDVFAADLGIACGLAFDRAGTLFVGDRSGTVFRMGPDGQARPFATLPPSVAAFHLAMSPADVLYATAPTLGAYDHVYRIDGDGSVTRMNSAFGRPQGLAFDSSGRLHVVEALAGESGLHRLRPDGDTDLVIAAPALVGVAFGPEGVVVVASNDTVYRFGLPEP